jgi:hypothetical protein
MAAGAVFAGTTGHPRFVTFGTLIFASATIASTIRPTFSLRHESKKIRDAH